MAKAGRTLQCMLVGAIALTLTAASIPPAAAGGHSHAFVGINLSYGFGGYGYGYGYAPYPYYGYWPRPIYAPPPVVYAPPPVVYSPPLAYAQPPVVGTPTSPPYTSRSGQTCREYQSNAIVNGRSQPVYGTACLQPDGTWRIVN